MRGTAAAVVVIGLVVAAPLGAQERDGWDRDRVQGVPPGHLPPPGACRVWYDNRPPGHQPPVTNCREAERAASRNRHARVIYGGSRDRRDNGWSDRDSRYQYPNRFPGGYGYGSVPFDNGYKDGYDKGRGDARDHRAYDPVRQSRYRSADHRYDRRYGSKDNYRDVYRDGFRAGYNEGYRDSRR